MLGKTLLAAAAAIAGLLALPTAASAGHDPYYERGGYDRGYDRGYRDDYRRYRRGDYYRGDYGYRRRYGRYGYRRGYARCGDGTTGAIVGGAVGALVGRDVARGERRRYYRRGRDGSGTVGAILGGAVGALVGREIDRSC
jgi:hypothetical protein